MPTISYTDVSNATTLSADIAAIDLASQGSTTHGTTYTIDLAAGATLIESADLDAVNLAAGDTLDIIGNGATLDGANRFEGLFVYAGQVVVSNLTIAHAKAQGGSGGSDGGGGGGAGLGGGLFIVDNVTGDPGAVTLQNLIFSGDSAVGGAGGIPAGSWGGGGGLNGGNGGAGAGNYVIGGGGGGIGLGANGYSQGTASGTGIVLGASNQSGGGGGGLGAGVIFSSSKAPH